MNKILLATLMLLPPCLAHADASEADIRDELAQQGYGLFLDEGFTDLDYLAGEYLGNESRTLSGQWMINKLHDGILSTGHCACEDEAEVIEMEQRAARWIAENPDSPTAHIVYAAALRKHGWWFRGNDYATDVPARAWKPYRKYIEKARSYLMERKDMLASDPRWYSAMVQIATDQGWPMENFSGLLRQATERHPYYYPIHYEAIRYLSPKRHGNAALLEGMANYAASITQEKEGAGLYALIYWDAADREFGRDLIIDNPHVWDRMRAAMEDVLAHYPAQWNIINFARLACVARDRDTAVRMITRIDEKLVPGAWCGGHLTYKKYRDWAMGI